ncbi:MAG TPA: FtsX-like permease family protein [Thermoanaerobaculia bacterium]
MEIGPILRSMRRNKPRYVLIAAEVALTLAIVANCLALITDARSEMTRESGFDDEHLVWARTASYGADLVAAEDAAVRDLLVRDLAALRSMPGVRAVTATFFRPWQGGGSSFEVLVDGREMEKVRSQVYTVDPGIYETLGVEVTEGRALRDEDVVLDPDATRYPVTISRGLADLLFPDGGAVGQVLTDSEGQEQYPVVGVFEDFYNPYSWPIHEQAVFFALPAGSASVSGFLVRAEPGQTQQVAGAIEARLLAVEDERVVALGTIPELRDQLQAGQRLMVVVLELLMALLVFVTALGIVGLTAFSVAERRRTIGTRRALGATRAAVLRYFLVENWLVVTLGAAIGLALAVGLNVGLLEVVEGARLGTPILAGGVLLLWAIGLAAALGPALRGARVEPAVATRNV